jgi:hypothetical protein
VAWKRLRSINKARWKKSKPEVEAAKTGLSGLEYWSIQIFLKR